MAVVVAERAALPRMSLPALFLPLPEDVPPVTALPTLLPKQLARAEMIAMIMLPKMVRFQPEAFFSASFA